MFIIYIQSIHITSIWKVHGFDNVGGKIAIYVVLGLLVLAFLFFVINTIRCYMTRPRFDDEEELDDYEQHHGINPNKQGGGYQGYQQAPNTYNQAR